MAFIRTSDGTSLYYRDWGRGEPMVFVASQSVTCDLWNYTIPFFTQRDFRCISFDRRGHGRSDQPSGGYDIDTLASDLGAVLAELDLDRVTLVGHSLGGAEVIRYLARHGRRVRRAVLLAPTAPYLVKTDDNPTGIDPALIEATRAAWLEDFPKWVRDGADAFFGQPTSPELTAWAISLMLPIPLYVQLLVSRASGADLRADLPGIDVPTLFVHGEDDASVPFAFGKAAARLVPNSRFLGYPGAAHGLLLTHAKRLHEDMLAFMRG